MQHRARLFLLAALASTSCGSSEATPGPEPESNHAIVVGKQKALSATVKSADAIVVKAGASSALSYALARHASLVKRSAALDAESATIDQLIAAKKPVPDSVLAVMAFLVDDLRDDATSISEGVDQAEQKALAAEDAAYQALITSVVAGAVQMASAIDTWREASGTTPAKTSQQSFVGKLAFTPTAPWATWVEALLPGTTTVTVTCTSNSSKKEPTVVLDAGKLGSVQGVKVASLVFNPSKTYLAHLRVTVTTSPANQPADCVVKTETPWSDEQTPALTAASAAMIADLIQQRDAAYAEVVIQSEALMAATTKVDPGRAARLRGALEAMNDSASSLLAHTPATAVDAAQAAKRARASTNLYAELLAAEQEEAAKNEESVDEASAHKAAVTDSIKKFLDIVNQMNSVIR